MPSQINTIILNWYQHSKRELPWRNTKDPYVIWISEIILQQTRMEQGLPYFHRFVQRFPDITSLASASEDEVLKLWQGLGYYSRARNMHHTAKRIHADYQGVFPESFDELKKLKGIGDYTASLIASVCFNKPYAVVDGNVNRLISRLYAVKEAVDSSKGKAEIKELADQLTDTNRPGDFNQAMMDFGSLICTPRNPLCRSCPLSGWCMAFKQAQVSMYPVKNPKKELQKRYLNYFFISNTTHVLIKKRRDKDIWQNLYELPLIENEINGTDTGLIRKHFGFSAKRIKRLQSVKHKLSHRELHISFYEAESESDLGQIANANSFELVLFSELGNYAFPKPIENFFLKCLPIKTESK